MPVGRGMGGARVETATEARITASGRGRSPAQPRQGSSRRLRLVLLATDGIAAGVPWAVVAATGAETAPATSIVVAAVLVATTLAVLGAQHLYRSRVCRVRAFEIAGILRAAAASGLTAAALTELTGRRSHLLALACAAAATVVLLLIGRAAYQSWLDDERRRGRHRRTVVVVGGNTEATAIADLFADHPELGYRVVGFVGEPVVAGTGEPTPIVLGGTDAAVRVARERGAGGIIVATTAVTPEQANQLLRDAHAAGLHVHLSNGLRGIERRRIVTQHFAHEPFLYVERLCHSPVQRYVKRALDVVIASGALALSAPLLAVSAVAVKVHDGGPIFYSQSRIGRQGRAFRMYKLRTMDVGADARIEELAARNARRGGPLFKLDDDPRITRVGRFLRATSIDELPQLWNVLRGEMSIVGPRPALPAEVAQFDEQHLQRLEVRPGVTGLWQMGARDNAAFSAYRRLDLHYVENWSTTLDFAIIIGTAWELLLRPIRSWRGARVAEPTPVSMLLAPEADSA